MAEVTETIERADGRAMAVRRLGVGPPLVCLAGGPGANARYLEDLAGLDAAHELIIPDSRGTGASAPATLPSGYAFDALAEDVEVLRQHLGSAEIQLLAHSAACTTALVYASRHPGNIQALVLVAPSRWLYDSVADDTGDILRSRHAEAWYHGVVSAQHRLNEGPDPDEVPDLLTALAPAAYAGWGPREQAHAATMTPDDWAASRSFWRADVDGEAIRRRLALVEASVLVITGGLDGATGVNAGAAWADVFATGTHVNLARSGHHPWVDEPEAFANHVGAFLAGQSASGTGSTASNFEE